MIWRRYGSGWLPLNWRRETCRKHATSSCRRYAVAGRTAVDTMRALAGMAETLAKDGDLAQAVAVLTLVAGHRFTDHATRKAVQVRLDEMEREVAPSEFDAWRQAGGGLSLDGTVASLIRNEHTL